MIALDKASGPRQYIYWSCSEKTRFRCLTPPPSPLPTRRHRRRRNNSSNDTQFSPLVNPASHSSAIIRSPIRWFLNKQTTNIGRVSSLVRLWLVHDLPRVKYKPFIVSGAAASFTAVAMFTTKWPIRTAPF